MKPCVVVTGIGAVSPNGIGREAFWKATTDGISGVRRIRRFDPAALQVQIAGEVPDFDESRYVDERERKHVSRAVPLGLAAIREALLDAGIDHSSMTRDQLRGVRVLVRSGGGSAEFNEEQYRLYYAGHQKQ
jgi:3-oxoacyl-[acyl-carrier-protein] synthase II